MSNIQKLLESCDEEGNLKITYDQWLIDNHKERQKATGKPAGGKESLCQQILKTEFSQTGLLNAFCHNKAHLKQLNKRLEKHQDGVTLTFNLLDYLQVKTEDKKKSFSQLQTFFNHLEDTLGSIKIDGKYPSYGSLSVYNNKNKQGKTVYTLDIKSRSEKNDDKVVHYQDKVAALQTYLEDKEFVQQVLLACAYQLNKIGPYSWTTIQYHELNDV